MNRTQKFATAVIGAVLAASILAGAFVSWRASRALRQATQEVRSEREIRFVTRPFLPLSNSNFEAVSSPNVFLRTARFQDHLYIAGPSGLSEYDLGGTLLRQFVAGRELPSSPLVTMAVGALGASSDPVLMLGTATEGILVFDGRGLSITPKLSGPGWH